MKYITRYIQGIRIYCPYCKALVTPNTVIVNDDNGVTVELDFECDIRHSKMKIAKFVPEDNPGKD